MKHLLKYGLFVILGLSLYSCSGSEEDDYDEDSFEDGYDEGGRHYDDDYKYEYREGSSGDYEYNYDVEGYDEDGNYVYGNVDMEGKYGTGYVEDANGDEVNIELEWYDYGEMSGYDENGVYYELSPS